jgi:hypothetical protein
VHLCVCTALCPAHPAAAPELFMLHVALHEGILHTASVHIVVVTVTSETAQPQVLKPSGPRWCQVIPWTVLPECCGMLGHSLRQYIIGAGVWYGCSERVCSPGIMPHMIRAQRHACLP